MQYEWAHNASLGDFTGGLFKCGFYSREPFTEKKKKIGKDGTYFFFKGLCFIIPMRSLCTALDFETKSLTFLRKSGVND